jgi:hypothetical protein
MSEFKMNNMRLIFWLMGVLLSSILGIGGILLQGMRTELAENRQSLQTQMQKVAIIEEQYKMLNARLERIEAKLDLLIDGRRR